MSAPLQARPTTYNGIAMRSRLEAKIAAHLDHLQLEWTYETRVFASERGQYLPDFHVPKVMLDGGPSQLYIEGVATLEKMKARRERERAILDKSTAIPLLYIGWGWVTGAGSVSWFGGNHELAILSNDRLRENRPTLYVGHEAESWLNGWLVGAHK